MNIKISKSVLFAMLAVILAIGAYWYWSPYLALKQMQSAAKVGDADAFNDHVDYPRLRESLKGQMSAMIAQKMDASKKSDNPFAAFGSVLGLLMVDKIIEAMVRPEVVMKAMQNGKFGPNSEKSGDEPSSNTDKSATAETMIRWDFERKGADKLIAHAKSESEQVVDNKASVVFERSGFANWKLTEIRLPALKP
jgi:hypothetical protein